MAPNPFLGVIFHWIGGLASASFYIPYRGIRRWSWETYWLVGGFFSWIIAPWFFALFMTSDLFGVLRETPASTLFWTYFYGLLWGTGGLTFGLTMRYLGISLGMAVALGFCAAFGTLVPPIFHGEFASKVLGTQSGLILLLGVLVCFGGIGGIGVSGLAGMTKERQMSEEQKRAVIKKFSFRKGILVATFSGIMSACFSFGLDAGEPIKLITLRHGTRPLWQGLPVLVVVPLGGFTTYLIWCLYLNFRNQTGAQYFRADAAANASGPALETAVEAPGEEMARQADLGPLEPKRAPMLANYLLCAGAGVTWYFQFFFYTMGESQMGQFKFSSWTLHMASIIIFSTLWGLALREWRGASARAHLRRPEPRRAHRLNRHHRLRQLPRHTHPQPLIA